MRILFLLIAALISLNGCSYMRGGTDMNEVANASGLVNVTTGDGNFENYKATGHYTATELGVGFGFPGLGTLYPLAPARSNEELTTDMAQSARTDGANAMINVRPVRNTYVPIPLIVFGIYIDRTEGTGIRPLDSINMAE